MNQHPFWRENVIAMVSLLRALARMSYVVTETSYQMLEVLLFCDRERALPSPFTAVHKDGNDDFHEHLNRHNADIQFTKEIEENGKIPFLDCSGAPNVNFRNISVRKTI